MMMSYDQSGGHHSEYTWGNKMIDQGAKVLPDQQVAAADLAVVAAAAVQAAQHQRALFPGRSCAVVEAACPAPCTAAP